MGSLSHLVGLGFGILGVEVAVESRNSASRRPTSRRTVAFGHPCDSDVYSFCTVFEYDLYVWP